jgi:predicted transcriptional regulator
MSKATSIRLDDQAKREVEAIQAATGARTVTDVVVQAVHRLHQEVTRVDPKEIEVIIDTSDEAMFGNDSDAVSQVDARASTQAFLTALRQRLVVHYGTRCDITVSGSPGNSHVYIDGMTGTDEAAVVDDIIHELWESWSWLVPA